MSDLEYIPFPFGFKQFLTGENPFKFGRENADNLDLNYLKELIKENLKKIKKTFEGMPEILREIDLSDYFVHLTGPFDNPWNVIGYKTAQKNLEEILSGIPKIVRMSDKKVYEKYFN